MFSSLPTELAEYITDHLDVDSFRSFRLVSHWHNQQSLYRFRQRFFHTQTVVWTPESLERLKRITSDPYFGRSLQHLIVDATPRFEICWWELGQQIIENDIEQAEDRRNYVLFSPHTRQYNHKRKILQAQYMEAEAKSEQAMKFWNETRHDLKSLTSAFEHLGRLQSVIFTYDGMKNFLHDPIPFCVRIQDEMSRPVISTLAAVAMSGLIVQSITIDSLRAHGAVSIDRLESVSPLLTAFDDDFLGLKVLKLNLRDWRSPGHGLELSKGETSFLVRFLSKMRNLEHLDLSCFSRREEDILSQMAQHCRYPRMKFCRLHVFKVSCADDLLRFLEPAYGSLESLVLSHCTIEDDHWSQVMIGIASRLRLQRVHLSNLFTPRRTRVIFDGTIERTLVLEEPNLENTLLAHSSNLTSENYSNDWHIAHRVYPFLDSYEYE